MSTRKWFVVGGLGVVVAVLIAIAVVFDRIFVAWRWISEVLTVRMFLPDSWSIFGASPVFYFWVGVLLLIVAVLSWQNKLRGLRWLPTYAKRVHYTQEVYAHTSPWQDEVNEPKETPAQPGSSRRKVLTLVTGLLAVAFLGAYVPAIWMNDRDAGASYADSTTFIVKDLSKQPRSLKRLMDDAVPGRDGDPCKLLGGNGVHACIQQGDVNVNFVQRKASATGAAIVLKRATEGDSLTQALDNSITYLYGAGDSGKWSAIRDGKRRQPITSIMEWDGEGRTTDCLFDGNYKLDLSFGGWWGPGTNLGNGIAKRFPGLLYDDTDVWGYCKDSGGSAKEPIVVIPVYKQVVFGHRTTTRPAGVIVVRGTPSGKPNMFLDEDVSPGEYPGPVYSAAVTIRQRELVKWSAGWSNNVTHGFGYDTSGVESQKGNPSEYFLKDKATGRLFWATPMRPKAGDSEQLVAYSMVAADEVHAGRLNEHRVYVLNDGDPRIVDLKRMEARVTDAVNRRQGAFFTGEDDNKGKLVEFLPVSADKWQVYAERGGNVVYRINVSIDERIQPEVLELVSQTPTTTEDACTKPRSQLSPEQLADCIKKFADELGGRKSNK